MDASHAHLSRRDFLKVTGLGAAAVTLSPMLAQAAAPPRAYAEGEQEDSLQALQQPTFNAMASQSALLGAITDVSMGWDGTVWGITGEGAPHLYDPMQDVWNPFGDGIDAATIVYSGVEAYRTIHLFRGNQYVSVTFGASGATTSAPVTIATAWPNAPDSFKLGLAGAASANGKVILIKGGLYAPADGSAPTRSLSDMLNWPQTSTWADGLIDAVFSKVTLSTAEFYLFRDDEYIIADFQTATVTQGPQPASTILPQSLANIGIDAATSFVGQEWYFFSGTAYVAGIPGVALAPRYIGTLPYQLPATWFPSLNHAPSGRTGNVWASANGSSILQHDGAQWNVIPGLGPSAAAGQDGSVFVIGTNGGLFQWDGTQFNSQGSLGGLAQVSVGDAGHVWVRGSNNAVYRYINNAFSPVNLGAGVPAPTHIAANADGTLWHCTSGNPNTFRFIPEATAPSEPITVKGGGIVTSVSRVATTGFGSAYCIASQGSGSQLYRYDSPYVFKTANAYSLSERNVIEHGLGMVFLVSEIGLFNDPIQAQTFIVALDAHTGAEVARTAPLPVGWLHSGVTFDPQLELLYVGTTPYDVSDNQSQAQLLALDARTLQVVWSYSATRTGQSVTVKGVDNAPGLSGSVLCFGDRGGNLFLLDTNQALAQAQQQQPIQEVWMWSLATTVFSTLGDVRITTPVFAAGRAYGAIYNVFESSSTMQSAAFVRNVMSATYEQTIPLPDVTSGGLDFGVLLRSARHAPVAIPSFSQSESEVPGLVIHGNQNVWVVDPTGGTPIQTFTLPSGFINTGFGYDDGTRAGQALSNALNLEVMRLWFGDSLGNVWSLNRQLSPSDHTPYPTPANLPIWVTPLIYKDPSGGATVLFGASNLTSSSLDKFLFGFNPDSGNLSSLATGQTAILALSKSASNGVVYAGGYDTASSLTGIPQAFGIRIDSLTQGLRDFVVDSQMMQDPDETAPGGDPSSFDSSSGGSGQASNDPIPPSRARYQTHVTVINSDPANPGSTTPMSYEPVKIWADAPTTIAVNGTVYAIGPGDADYAQVQTGGDGAVVIASGYVTANGADAPDLYATTLRLWASFMNPYERIVVHPDYEFHGRVSRAQANPSNDDPDAPNLVTTRSYAATTKIPTPAPIFTTNEISAGQPQNCANAIGQMRSGVGFGASDNSAKTQFTRQTLYSGGSKAARRTIRRNRAALLSAAQSPQKYVAYPDLQSMAYFPNNGQAPRPVTVVQPTGLQFTKPQGQPTTAAALAISSHTQAQLAIDALPPPTVNPPWESTATRSIYTPLRADSIFSDFWDWLKKAIETAVVEITHVIVSVADEVLVGIRLLVNGVEQVFKAVVRVLDDIASAVGALFSMLLKYVEDVIAVMSVIFQFGQIIQTHTALKTELLSRINQLSTTVIAQVKSNVDTFFNQGEAAITSLFDQIRSEFENQAIAQQPKMGSTAHTALTINAPAGSSNQAVQGMWATQKLKTGLGSATTPPSQQTPASDDPLSDFLDGFVASLTGNGALASVFNQLKSDLARLISPGSAKQFFSTLMSTLIDIVEALLVGALAIGQALVDGLLDALPSVLQDLFGPSGLLVAPLNVPVLSWLYQKLSGSQLSFVDVVVLVAAIPVTIIYRVAFGIWPADDDTQARENRHMESGVNTGQATTFSVKALGRALTLFSGIATLVHGIVTLFVDIEPEPSAILKKVSATIGMLNTASAFPVSDISKANSYDISEFGLRVCNAVLTVIGLKQFQNPTTQEFMTVFLPSLRAGLNLDLLIVSVVGVVTKNQSDGFSFVARIIDTFPGIVKPLKLAGGETARLVVGAVDLVSGLAGGALKIVSALPSGGVTPQRRLFFPWISMQYRQIMFTQ